MKLDAAAKYMKSHEWIRPDGTLFVIGITDYAQDQLSDVVYVELPAVGETYEQGEVFGVAESTKAASDLYMPVSGEIVEANETLEDAPELVNEDAFGGGWMIKIKANDPSQLDALMTSEAYQTAIDSGEIE